MLSMDLFHSGGIGATRHMCKLATALKLTSTNKLALEIIPIMKNTLFNEINLLMGFVIIVLGIR